MSRVYIHEAIKATSKRKPFITRRAWGGIVTNEAHKTAIKIQPTDTPAGCVVVSEVTKDLRPGWTPRAEDLAADDWDAVSL